MKTGIALGLVALVVTSTSFAFQGGHRERGGSRRAEDVLFLGICVGQELTKQGITFAPGDRLSTLDETTLTSLAAAYKDCQVAAEQARSQQGESASGASGSSGSSGS